MSATITNAFITQFESEVHMAYQRMGSKFKNLVRVVNGVSGESVKFQKVGTGEATTKARHAEVVAMNISHTNVTATLSDFYASDYVDKLDELKTNMTKISNCKIMQHMLLVVKAAALSLMLWHLLQL